MAAKILNVIKGSIADKNGIVPGDIICTINDKPITDYLDYMYNSCNEELEIKLENRTINIRNEDYEPLGVEFETLLIDSPKVCRNKCIFCFIDQLPQNMRKSCYFKDDDYRLSFLQGNYVTLTNMSDAELDRIVEYNLPRINISVHTTNPDLRIKMLNNKNAGKILEQIERFSNAGISLNCQIVLCKGYNDGEELERTISDLAKYSIEIESVSIVPVGLSDFREGLTKLEMFTPEDCRCIISQVNNWQKKFREKLGIDFIYLSDEFYIMANKELPDYEYYDGFPQIENGVGLCTSLKFEFEDAIKNNKKINENKKKTIATGALVNGFIRKMIINAGFDNVDVISITNTFFGEKITVTGLITGQDIIEQLKDKDLGEELLISTSMLRHNEDVFLDNLTVKNVEDRLKIKVVKVLNDGYELLNAILN